MTLFGGEFTSNCFHTICVFVVTPSGKSRTLIMGPAKWPFLTRGVHCFTELLQPLLEQGLLGGIQQAAGLLE